MLGTEGDQGAVCIERPESMGGAKVSRKSEEFSVTGLGAQDTEWRKPRLVSP